MVEVHRVDRLCQLAGRVQARPYGHHARSQDLALAALSNPAQQPI